MKKKGAGGKFRHSPEGAVFRLGLYMVLCWLLFFALLSWYIPDYALKILKVPSLHCLGGRAAGISKGLLEDLPKLLVVPLVFLTDMTMVLVFYPLIVFSHKYGIRRRLSGEAVFSTVAEARKQRRWIRRFGVAGLVFFVWFPFYMTGPLIGAVIGYFLKLRPWVNVAAVGAGTLAATICWAYVFESLLGIIDESHVKYVPLAIVVLVAVLWLTGRLLRKNTPDLPEEDEE